MFLCPPARPPTPLSALATALPLPYSRKENRRGYQGLGDAGLFTPSGQTMAREAAHHGQSWGSRLEKLQRGFYVFMHACRSGLVCGLWRRKKSGREREEEWPWAVSHQRGAIMSD